MAASNRRTAPPRARRATRRPTSATTERRGFWNYPRREHTGLHRWLPSWRVVLGTFIGGVFLVLGAGVAAFALINPDDPLAEVEFQTTTVYFAGEEPGTPGPEMGTFAKQKREIVDYATLPAHIGQAVAAGEDQTFFTNRGVSLTGMARAFLNNIQGKPTQGGSTLTQQYVERYYQNTTKDYWGKAKEAILAIKISQKESKEQIMGRYLNTIYFGRDSYGIQAAAQSYFAKNAADLTVAESAMLAALIPSPNNWDPAVAPEKAQQRWEIVLDRMVTGGWLTAEERAAQTFPPTVEYVKSETYRGPNGYLLEMVEKELLATKFWTADELRTRGLKIVTTIDPTVQQIAVQSAAQLRAGELTGGATPNERLRMSIVTVDPATGGIVALYGGSDYLTDTRNTATFDQIQAGSTYKPFTLVAALEQGISLGTTYDARSPQEFDIGEAKPWRVQNYANSNKYGTIDLVRATADSVNTVYAQLNLEVGPAETARVAQAAGATDEPTTVASNVLGSDTVHPLDMTNAYATFAAQGVHRDAHIVQAVIEGESVWSPDTTGEQVFAADVMADTTYAMTQVVERGSATNHVKPLRRPIAGKTGTSTENKSAWFIGYTPQLATSVALSQIGEDDRAQDSITAWGQVREITGGSYPALLWSHYMKQVFEQPRYTEVQEFPARANVGGKATPAPTETATEEPEVPEEPEAPAEVQVPGGLVGRTEADAAGALQGAGLVPAVVTERSTTVPTGRVIRVEPGEGASVAGGSTVTIVVSSGPPPQPTPTPPPAPAPEPTPTVPPEGGAAAGGGTAGGQAGAAGGTTAGGAGAGTAGPSGGGPSGSASR
ncbi:transglycosylase domain-containing protein [Cellulomonas sp. KH9]|uniref:penicillin-binding protein n=1 Tax=Cellulomonas sp. KH9 TaxID=1855324 RepID=UPI0008E06922|nr:transglycosylase domain-containing protein [Cellulomonas sp. KH9]SFK49272.1 Membrane carboxypeptidase (penicillin-binding protein) [Cellulomonas sp. KH9]